MGETNGHLHKVGPTAEPGTREWIRQGGHSFGAEPYEILLEETRQITDNIEVEIRVIRWKIAGTVAG